MNIQKNERMLIIRPVKLLYFSICFIVGILIIIKSGDYVVPDFSAGFLSGKQRVFWWYRFFLYAHITAAPIALLAGLFQFTFTRSSWHKYAGKLYVFSVLLLAAPAGFIMALLASGGLWSLTSFLFLSTLWFYFTLKSYHLIRKGEVWKHSQYMTRSFILANSAILIRILSWFNHHYAIMDPMSGYVLISWLSWLPGLLVYEVWLRAGVLVPGAKIKL